MNRGTLYYWRHREEILRKQREWKALPLSEKRMRIWLKYWRESAK